jgi:glucose/arabinose dehydrogenase
MKSLIVAAVLLLGLNCAVRLSANNGSTFSSAEHEFRVVTVTAGLQNPWGMAFLPDGRILLTERFGGMKVWDGASLIPVGGVLQVQVIGQGGLLDVELHPDFASSSRIYICHAASYGGGFGLVVQSAVFNGEALTDVQEIFRSASPPGGGSHFGSRLAFDRFGYLYITTGDRGTPSLAQDLDSHYGKVLRLHDDGSIPDDNPFVNEVGAHPEIYSYGHRNPQGLHYDLDNEILWLHEHGPQGGDALHIIHKGSNYGWPIATYGVNYGSGIPIGTTPDQMEEVENPITWWGPTSIAPSGLTLFRGAGFPQWRNNLFLGALAQQHIRRLKVVDGEVLEEEELLRNTFGRIRDINVSPEGDLYFITDSSSASLYRIEPVQWGGWGIEDYRVNTGTVFPGTLDIRHAPFVFHEQSEQWLYMPEPPAEAEGFWYFHFRRDD